MNVSHWKEKKEVRLIAMLVIATLIVLGVPTAPASADESFSTDPTGTLQPQIAIDGTQAVSSSDSASDAGTQDSTPDLVQMDSSALSLTTEEEVPEVVYDEENQTYTSTANAERKTFSYGEDGEAGTADDEILVTEELDANGRVLQKTDHAQGKVTVFSYNDEDQIYTATTDNLADNFSYGEDDLAGTEDDELLEFGSDGRIVKSTTLGGTVTTFEYDDANQTYTATSDVLIVKNFSYGEDGIAHTEDDVEQIPEVDQSLVDQAVNAWNNSGTQQQQPVNPYAAQLFAALDQGIDVFSDPDFADMINYLASKMHNLGAMMRAILESEKTQRLYQKADDAFGGLMVFMVAIVVMIVAFAISLSIILNSYFTHKAATGDRLPNFFYRNQTSQTTAAQQGEENWFLNMFQFARAIFAHVTFPSLNFGTINGMQFDWAKISDMIFSYQTQLHNDFLNDELFYEFDFKKSQSLFETFLSQMEAYFKAQYKKLWRLVQNQESLREMLKTEAEVQEEVALDITNPNYQELLQMYSLEELANQVARTHLMLNPPKDLHPLLAMFLFGRINPQTSSTHSDARAKLRMLLAKAKADKAQSRYRGDEKVIYVEAEKVSNLPTAVPTSSQSGVGGKPGV